MDTPSILPHAHAALALTACGSLWLGRARNLATALFLFCVADAVFIHGASWQTETALSYIGPTASVTAVACTVGASMFLSAALAVPTVFFAAICVAHGVELGGHGIAWCLAAANVYTAFVGVLLLRVGARQISRFQAMACGLVVATSAPAVVGWSCRAIGNSVQVATVVDCVFLAALVVTSSAEWTRRWQITSSPRSQALSSGH